MQVLVYVRGCLCVSLSVDPPALGAPRLGDGGCVQGVDDLLARGPYDVDDGLELVQRARSCAARGVGVLGSLGRHGALRMTIVAGLCFAH